MINFYVEKECEIIVVNEPCEGCWVRVTDPSDAELRLISAEYALPMDAVKAALDLDERSRVDYDDDWRMLLVNIPTREETNTSELYTTIPLAIILAGGAVITICSKDSHVLRSFANGSVRDFHPNLQSRFVFQILYATARRYLLYLRMVEKKSDAAEEEFRKHQKNKELLDLMKLEKSLVYFTTGLRSNEAVLEKLVRTNFIRKFEEDADLLEDAVVENKQAIEMAKINSEIIANMSNTFASVISNNLNLAMKVLAMITLVMAIPTMIFSAYGMNFPGANMPLVDNPFGFPIIIAFSLVLAVMAMLIIWRLKIFK